MRARIIMARLKNEDNKLKILDAGCGYGLYALMLSELGFQVDAVDIDERRTNIVNQMLDEYPVIKKKVSIYTVSLVNLPFSSNTYDIIICPDVIEHIVDDKKVVSELSRILKPGGELILSVPYKSKYQQKIYKKFEHERPGYTKEELKELVQTCNMEIKKVYYYQRWFGNILFKVYNALSQKVLIGLLFYPFYGLYLLDYYFGQGEPNGIIVTIRKSLS